MEEFKEKFFGDAEGMLLKERLALYPDHQYPNQEDDEALSNRIMTGLEKIHQVYQNQKVLLVAHGAVINSILAQLSNGELGYGKTKLQNACINEIHFCGNQWKLASYNQVAHLTQLSGKG